jgi:DNA-directed RNA polymerase sigma subunit (sigma70/sigma32)
MGKVELSFNPFVVGKNSTITDEKLRYLYLQRKRKVTCRSLSKELGITSSRVQQLEKKVERRIRKIKKLKHAQYSSN